MGQAAKDEMPRDLQGSCDPGAKVSSLVITCVQVSITLSSFSGSKVSTLDVALIRTVKILQGRGKRRLNVCISKDLKEKAHLWSKKSYSR